jgi:hypothetical protein
MLPTTKSPSPISSASSARTADIGTLRLASDWVPSSEEIDALADSIQKIGLKTPITVDESGWIVAGVAHFLAMQKLGYTTIEVFVLEDPQLVRLWRLSENLHRRQLSSLERSVAIAEWTQETKPGQHDQVTGGRGRQGGLSQTARDLRLPRSALRRASKIATLTPAARAAAKQAGISDNQALLLSAAEEQTEAEQLAKIKAFGDNKRDLQAHPEIEFRRLTRAWAAASPDVKQRFVTEIISPSQFKQE